MDVQHFLFYIILSNYVWSIFFYQNKDHNVRQIRFHVCIKMRHCKRRVCRRKTLNGQPNIKHTKKWFKRKSWKSAYRALIYTISKWLWNVLWTLRLSFLNGSLLFFASFVLQLTSEHFAQDNTEIRYDKAMPRH